MRTGLPPGQFAAVGRPEDEFDDAVRDVPPTVDDRADRLLAGVAPACLDNL